MADANVTLLATRTQRLRDTVALKPTDRVPVVPLGNAVAARLAGAPLEIFIKDPQAAYRLLIEVFTGMGEIDGTQQAHFSPYLLSMLWNSRVKLPGIDLPADSLWQVEEAELMTAEDYDLIISRGYPAFVESLFRDRIPDPGPKLGPYFQTVPAALQAWLDRGIPVLALGVVTVPFEAFCGARSLRAFILDLMRTPDKVEEAMRATMPVLIEGARQFVRAFPDVMGVWVGGWRTASHFLAPALWERFVFPYYRELVAAVAEEGVIPILHFDADWGRDLPRLRELPPRTCILALDGATDIRRAKEILGDHMAIMGDVPAQLLTLGTPDQVYDYARGLIRDIGPTGFILSSGCDIPYSARAENVKAMIAAAND